MKQKISKRWIVRQLRKAIEKNDFAIVEQIADLLDDDETKVRNDKERFDPATRGMK